MSAVVNLISEPDEITDQTLISVEHTLLKLGGKQIAIPPLYWDLLEIVWPIFDAKKENPDTTERQIIETAMQVIEIACSKSNPEVTMAWLKRHVTFKDREVVLKAYVELLDKSGFITPGEAEAAMRDGMETSSPSLPNVPVEGFVEEIGNELNPQ